MNSKNREMLRQVAIWARQNGKPRPTTDEGWRVLFAEYMSQQTSPMGSFDVATWEEIPGDQLYMSTNGVTMNIVDGPEENPSDFDELVNQREQALQETGGDALAAEVVVRDQDLAALNAAARFVRTNPVSVLQGTLGGTGLAKLGDPPLTLAYWTGADAETCPLTITIAPVAAQGVALGRTTVMDNLHPFAIVQFGSRGFAASVKLDVMNGAQFTVTGSQVVVQGGIEFFPTLGLPSPTPGVNNQLNLSAQVSFGSAQKNASLTLTSVIDLDHNAATTLDIPAFATSVAILPDLTLNNTPIELAFLNFLSSQYSSPPITWSALVPIPISGMAKRLQLSNTDNINNFRANVVFFLEL